MLDSEMKINIGGSSFCVCEISYDIIIENEDVNFTHSRINFIQISFKCLCICINLKQNNKNCQIKTDVCFICY